MLGAAVPTCWSPTRASWARSSGSTSAVRISIEADARSATSAAAGEPWDDLVAHTVAQGFVGLGKALSGIPGLTGATPIQNVGAYGSEVSDVVTQVRTIDRASGRVRTRSSPSSAASATAPPGSSTRSLRTGRDGRGHRCDLPAPARDALRTGPVPGAGPGAGHRIGRACPAADVRAAVLALRAGKGMVLSEGDHDTWSAGSFFTNPVLSADVAAALPAGSRAFRSPTAG